MDIGFSDLGAQNAERMQKQGLETKQAENDRIAKLAHGIKAFKVFLKSQGILVAIKRGSK